MSGPHTHALYVHGHSPVHRLAPEVKLAALGVFLIAVVATPREAIWAFGVYGFLVLAVVVNAELPLGFVGRRMVIEVPFVLFAVLLPFLGAPPTVEVAGFELSREGIWSAWNILAKATLGVACSVTLVATTEIPEILRGLDRLRVPRVLTAVAGFMVRYVDVILSELGRTRRAMAARGYQPRWWWQATPIAVSAGALFIRSYERGERVYQAMTARGYDGEMPAFGSRRTRPGEWAMAMALPLTAWLVLALVVIG